MRWIICVACLGLTACDVSTSQTPIAARPVIMAPLPMVPAQALQSFATVVNAVEPVAERVCREQTAGVNCDFRIVVDPNPDAVSNAYQSLDENGRPVITFTTALINETHNANELAFVLGHEAGHHIADHLGREQVNALTGAVILAGLTVLGGGSSSDIQTAQDIGAMVGGRSYSKDFELEADQLGTVISYYAGYNPLVGAKFFARIADPGDRFLGTHPPNAARLETVRRTSAQLGVPVI
jgi:Zn-dependent protease with chaperone function